ncbi:MAG: YidB family protein [Acetobacteraceae bacterium]|nr:YidB family protein [Acetobacteraceae bacterium]
MRYIHQVIEDLRGLPDDEVTPLGAALNELLGGERGSLPDLADRFTEAGLGAIMASWIGNGPNLPISVRDLRHVLGEERAEDLATLAGMTSGEFLVRLARLLPAAVHRMTPEGSLDVPAEP